MDDIRKLVRETYQQTIKDGPYPEEFKRALKTHERIPTFFDNLVREFSNPSLNVKRETVIAATRDMVRLFVSAVQVKAEERIMSPIKAAMIKAEAQRKKEMNALVDAFDKQGEQNEIVTQDKAGNETIKQQIIID